MFPVAWLGILSALASALAWGGGDFSGGLAARRSSSFQVLTISASSGVVLLLACMLVWREPLPPLSTLVWAALAGGSGAMGIAALYRALSLGNAATVAPTAAVVGAVLPVAFGLFTEGWPGNARLAGFLLAPIGIGLVSGASVDTPRRGFLLAWLAGMGFAGFFILLAQVEAGSVFAPLVVARCVSLVTAVALVSGRGLSLPSLTSNPAAMLAGVLDTGGNVFYVLAMQFTRLDVAVVLSAMYPAITIVLAWVILKERVSRGQWLGAGVCLLATGLVLQA